MQIREITDKSEFEQALNSGGAVLADFFAKWCAPCKLQTPILYEFYQDVQDKVEIIKIDVDENPQLADSLKITSIPTMVLLVDGEEKERRVGLTTKSQLSDMLIKYI